MLGRVLQRGLEWRPRASETFTTDEYQLQKEGYRNQKSRRAQYKGTERDAAEWKEKQESMSRLESRSFTVFVGNLHTSMTSSLLRQIFNFEGAFMPKKKISSNPALFGFVRFLSKIGATEAMKKLDGIVVRGSA